MGLAIWQIDAFAERPFGGNPAAVCLLPARRGERWMQAVAAEMNLSETAFLVPRGEAFDLRWFTPAVEVDLCGHATLASAHFLWESGRLPAAAAARFHTRSGLLEARRRGGAVEMDFPATPLSAAAAPAGLAAALGCDLVGAYRAGSDLLVEAVSEKALRDIAPDFRAPFWLDCRGVIVTAPGGGECDFVSRFFAPAAGIDEDPVTGSAHCALGPFWGNRLGKSELRGYQASRRGGRVGVRLAGDRVVLIGKAATVFRAELVEEAD